MAHKKKRVVRQPATRQNAEGHGNGKAVKRRLAQTRNSKVENLARHRQEKVNAKNNSSRIVLGMFLIGVLVICFTQAGMALRAKASTPYVTVQYGSIDKPVMIDAIIIRDEKVYKSVTAGIVKYNIKNLDKVKKDTAVCSIRNEEAVEKIENNMIDVERRILDLQQRREDISIVQPEVDKVNIQMKKMIDNQIHTFTTGQFDKMYKLKEDIDSSIQLRNQRLFAEDSASLAGLADEKQQYQQELDKNITMIYAEESGIVYDTVDGLEEKLTFENMENLSKEQTTMQVSYDQVNAIKEVGVNDSVFKMIRSNDWYICAYIANDLIIDYEEGITKTIFINQEQDDQYVPIQTTVSRIVDSGGESYVVFKCTKNMLDFINTRNLKIKTTDSVHRGLKIPINAIVDRTLIKIPLPYVLTDGERNVVKKRTDLTDETIDIVVKDRDDEYVYIIQDFNSIKVGDTLVSVESTEVTVQLNEIENVKGVYLINNGLAEFKKIVVEDNAPENSGYVILDPEINKSVQIYDRIISEAKNISDGQKVYE